MTDFKKIQENTEKRRQNAKSQKYFGIFLVSVIVLFFLVLAFLNLFNINNIEVTGISEYAPYDESEVIAFLDIQEGTNLITYDVKKASRSLMYNFPYVESVEMKRRFPSTLEIIIKENDGPLYIELGHDVFLLSAEGKVLECTEDPFYDGKRRCKLLVDGVKRCISGEYIVFDNSDSIDVIKKITSKLEKYSMFDMITELDVRDKFNVRMSYDGRFKIIFGTFENAEGKISLLSEMMDSDLWAESSGTIDVSSGSEALVKFSSESSN